MVFIFDIMKIIYKLFISEYLDYEDVVRIICFTIIYTAMSI